LLPQTSFKPFISQPIEEMDRISMQFYYSEISTHLKITILSTRNEKANHKIKTALLEHLI
jgi:hypothetical protein